MDNIAKYTNDKEIIIYKGYSLAQKKASAKYYYANKEKCIETSRRWAIEHKNERTDKERPEVCKTKRKIYNQQFYARQKLKQKEQQEQELKQEQSQEQSQEQPQEQPQEQQQPEKQI